MKIVSFNVNSIRQRLHQLEELINTHQPEVIALQETKVTDKDFPFEACKALGYHSAVYGQKTHYGVAFLSKSPIEVEKGVIGREHQTRFIATTLSYQGQLVYIYNGYFPQGENQTHPTKFADKRDFYQELMLLLNARHSKEDAIIILGDLNIAPEDKDVGIDNPQNWLAKGACSFLPEERAWLAALYDWGLIDSYRHCYPTLQNYSWFDYRTRAFDRSHKPGLRIDHILVTPVLQQRIVDAGIDYAIRSMEKPSDHAPIWTQFG